MRIVNDIAVALATYLEEGHCGCCDKASLRRLALRWATSRFPAFVSPRGSENRLRDIANDLKICFETDERDETAELLTKIERIETVSGYLNFFIKARLSCAIDTAESMEGGDRPRCES